MKKRYIDVEEAAEYLSLTVPAIYQRCRTGDMPHHRLGRLLRFDIQDLDLWMRRHRVPAKQAS